MIYVNSGERAILRVEHEWAAIPSDVVATVPGEYELEPVTGSDREAFIVRLPVRSWEYWDSYTRSYQQRDQSIFEKRIESWELRYMMERGYVR